MFKDEEGKVKGRVGTRVDYFLISGDHQCPEWMAIRGRIKTMYASWLLGPFEPEGRSQLTKLPSVCLWDVTCGHLSRGTRVPKLFTKDLELRLHSLHICTPQQVDCSSPN